MRRKTFWTAWKGGTVTVENNVIVIRQGKNTVLLHDNEERDAFVNDVVDAPLPKPIQHPGYGGTIEKLPSNPKQPKSMQQIVDEAELLAQFSTKKK